MPLSSPQHASRLAILTIIVLAGGTALMAGALGYSSTGDFLLAVLEDVKEFAIQLSGGHIH